MTLLLDVQLLHSAALYLRRFTIFRRHRTVTEVIKQLHVTCSNFVEENVPSLNPLPRFKHTHDHIQFHGKWNVLNGHAVFHGTQITEDLVN